MFWPHTPCGKNSDRKHVSGGKKSKIGKEYIPLYYSTELVFVVWTNNILHPRNPVFHEGCNIICHEGCNIIFWYFTKGEIFWLIYYKQGAQRRLIFYLIIWWIIKVEIADGGSNCNKVIKCNKVPQISRFCCFSIKLSYNGMKNEV